MLRDQDEKVESWKGLTFKVNEQENPVKKGYVGQVYNYYELWCTDNGYWYAGTTNNLRKSHNSV